jgi:hypothetical protein
MYAFTIDESTLYLFVIGIMTGLPGIARSIAVGKLVIRPIYLEELISSIV